ncbi:MAG: hypothetical protein ABF633_09290 [Clostridium sp.]|uniref:hypothetical protein n=1 Tax=Clostridium sp. TaxID=1506 RepID=UPI0039EA7B66
MGKPSIFSNRYRREMRKRRNRTITIIIVIAVVVVLAIILVNGSVNDWAKNNFNTKKVSQGNNDKKQNTVGKQDTAAADEKAKAKQEQQKPVDKTFTVAMPDGKALNIIYDDSSSTRKITNIQNQDSDIDFNINPTGTSAVAYEKSKQNVLLVNADGTSSDITNASYTSSNGTVFSKDSILAQNNNYIWQQSPKFIDDENIAYISQLPWFDNRPAKFIWKYNIKDKTNVNTNMTGTNIQINNINNKGLEIVVDNVTQYLKGDGSIAN